MDMGSEWLDQVVTLLTQAGIDAGEDHPTGPVPWQKQPKAVVALTALDTQEGVAQLTVGYYSPRALGGWACQTGAAEAAAALTEGGFPCRMGAMSYASGSDCYEIPITFNMVVYQTSDDGETPVAPASPWSVSIDGVNVEWVKQCKTWQDRQRRLLWDHKEGTPVGISDGYGGWEIQLVQELPSGISGQAMPDSAFTLVVTHGEATETYTGCRWNEVRRSHTAAGVTVQWQGFALEKE